MGQFMLMVPVPAGVSAARDDYGALSVPWRRLMRFSPVLFTPLSLLLRSFPVTSRAALIRTHGLGRLTHVA